MQPVIGDGNNFKRYIQFSKIQNVLRDAHSLKNLTKFLGIDTDLSNSASLEK
jgi:hypothetical protein